MRGYPITISTLELNQAFKVNYRVTKIYRAYHWDPSQMDESLFRKYVQKWMTLKYMSSGKKYKKLFKKFHFKDGLQKLKIPH